ncbi:DUF5330 domain-containing protein [Mangrovicella endophytica]|uniref:DUF5330 domain-containing protein n=1 Tax=Mangrovicella endophytica TaxID=2066697 RepID=UPI000C9E2686|nr:DUF5330 domain-containing protein [Mangrovicella endophytica]
MRFILKSAFWLGLLAFMLPGSGKEGPNISMFQALAGAEEALQDVTGFCSRAPQACETGRELAAFAGERIGDGMIIAYRLVGEQAEGRPALGDASADAAAEAGSAFAAAEPTLTDPVETGTIETLIRAPQPYLAPVRSAASDTADTAAIDETPVAETSMVRHLPIPSPAPRA